MQPVVIWHGMGDSCCSQHSIGAVKTLIEDTLGERGTGLLVAMSTWRNALASRAGSYTADSQRTALAPGTQESGGRCVARRLAQLQA